MIKPFLSIKKFDWSLFLAMLGLLVLGLVVQYNLPAAGQGLSDFSRQLIFAGGGLLLFFFVSFFDYRALKNYAYPLYGLALALAASVLFLGKTVNGTTGWIPLGIFNLQVVEPVKVLMIIFLAGYWAGRAREGIRPRDIAVSGLLTAGPVGIILLQPDLGSATVIVAVWLMTMLMAARKLKYAAIVFLLIAVVAASSWFFFLEDYQKDRLLTFVNPRRDPLGAGYQVTQSITAVGSGQLLGRGLGLGPQSQLNFLPAAATDFAFAVIAEELGFAGSFLVLGLYAFLLLRLIRIARYAYDNFSLFLMLGAVGALFVHFAVNVGMNVGLAPIMGIPLPLISYGGSSLFATMVILGMAESVVAHSVKSSASLN